MIAITGATGGLGRDVIAELLERGVDPSRIAALVRSPDKAAGLSAHGVVVRFAVYNKPETLPDALEGVEKLLLISGNEPGRVEQHANVIQAAVQAGVGSIAYTSGTKADTSGIGIIADHRATEKILAGTSIASTILRNNWYFENYTQNLPVTLQQGVILSATGGAQFNPAARRDYAAAAAAVLTSDGHDGKVYELAGPAVTLSDLAAVITEVTGTPVAVVELAPAEYRDTLIGAGLPEPVAAMLVGGDEGIARGDLYVESSDLADLVERAPITFAEVVRAAL